jgi:hypothetical protein
MNGRPLPKQPERMSVQEMKDWMEELNDMTAASLLTMDMTKLTTANTAKIIMIEEGLRRTLLEIQKLQEGIITICKELNKLQGD